MYNVYCIVYSVYFTHISKTASIFIFIKNKIFGEAKVGGICPKVNLSKARL